MQVEGETLFYFVMPDAGLSKGLSDTFGWQMPKQVRHDGTSSA
jgi:hypothetical protein